MSARLQTLFGCVLARILSYTTPDACQHALGFAWCICVTAPIQSLAQDLGIFRNILRMFIELDLPLSLQPNLALSFPHNRSLLKLDLPLSLPLNLALSLPHNRSLVETLNFVTALGRLESTRW